MPTPAGRPRNGQVFPVLRQAPRHARSFVLAMISLALAKVFLFTG